MNRARDIDPAWRLARSRLDRSAVGRTDDPNARRGIDLDAAFNHRSIHPPARRPAGRDPVTAHGETLAAGAQA